jgi:O-acetyl-ADP-ribose deacetylase (regulator of RNase III)
MFAALGNWLRRWRMTTLKPFGRGERPGGVSLSLGDRSAAVARALACAFDDAPGVEVVQGDLLDLSCDGIVAAANSFGDMGGGVDKAIDDFHRGAAQRALMAAIAEQFLGELPVGAALIVKVEAARFPFIVAAPTMRIPGDVSDTLNAYLALRAALVAVLRHNAAGGRAIRSLAVPGLGTGVGGLGPDEAAEQMRAAYDNVAGGGWRKVLSPVLAPFALRGLRRGRRSGG